MSSSWLHTSGQVCICRVAYNNTRTSILSSTFLWYNCLKAVQVNTFTQLSAIPLHYEECYRNDEADCRDGTSNV